MRFFASWWERFPVRKSVTVLVVVVAAFGAIGHLGGFIRALVGAAGSTWG
jgi:hypothetical protein